MRTKGFTLIELLVVIAIIVLLVSILVPSLNYARELARRATCAAGIKSVGSGLAIYENANSDAFPTITSQTVDAAAGGDVMTKTDLKDPATASTCPIDQLLPLIVEGNAQYDAFLCPSAPTGDRPTLDSDEYAFKIDGKYYVDYGFHLGWGTDASFSSLSDSAVIMADLSYNKQAGDYADAVKMTDEDSNHKDDGFNCLTRSGSVSWKKPEEITDDNYYPVVNQDNIYTNGTTDSNDEKDGGTVNDDPTSAKDQVLWVHGNI